MRKNYATQHSTSLKLAMLVAAFTMLAGFFASVPVAAQEITLEVMHRWGGDRHPLLREILDRFEEAHPGVKVVDIEAGVELHQKLVSSWLAGIGPDIAMVNWDSGPRFGMLGNLVSVDEFVKAEGTTIDSMIHPSIAEAIISEDGNTYFIPMTINLGRHLLYYNKRLFGEAGLDENNPPRTHSEWEQAARLLTRMDPDGTYSQRGIDMVTNNNERNFRLFETLTEQWDAQLFNPFTRAALPFLERNIQVAEWMIDFQQSLGPVNPSGASEGRPPFTNEQVAMYMGIDGDWFNFAQGSPHIDVGMSALPVPDGEPLRSVVVPGWGWGISSDTKHPELAWELLKWLSVAPDGGGWFIRQQGRMSSVPENNLDPEYFDVHAYWNVVIDVANAGIPFLPRCTLDLGTGELNGILGGALTKAGAGEASVRGLLEDAQRVLQARCDGAS